MSLITLYSTSGCHLCDEAQVLLEQLGVTYRVQDIIDDPQLVARYGITIPVVASANNNNELGWPFDLTELKQFLEL